MVIKKAVKTGKKKEIIDITGLVNQTIQTEKILNGAIILFVPHTTCGISINENSDPDVKTDILKWMKNAIPEDMGFLHSEGNSDAHIQSLLTGQTLHLVIDKGQLLLGVWQSIYFCEFDGPRNRELIIKLIKD